MSQPISEVDSRRLQVLRWPLIVLVVFIHANNDRIGLPAPEASPASWVHWIRKAISEGLAATAVPLFFLTSGYLFFAGKPLSRDSYLQKLRRRGRTLLVPYLFWNASLAAVFAVALRWPALEGFVSGEQGAFLDQGPLAWLDGVLGITQAPVSYPFWFLRDLMLVVVAAPLAAGMFRLGPIGMGMLLGGLGFYWLHHAWPLPVPAVVAVLFFFAGGALASEGRSLFPRSPLLLALAGLYPLVVTLEWMGVAGSWTPQLHQIGIGCGIVFVLAITAWVERWPRFSEALVGLSGSAFFLFAMHEPTLTLVRRVAYKVLPVHGPWMDLVHYFVTAAFVIAFGTGLHRVLQRVTPRFTAWITGGR